MVALLCGILLGQLLSLEVCSNMIMQNQIINNACDLADTDYSYINAYYMDQGQNSKGMLLTYYNLDISKSQ